MIIELFAHDKHSRPPLTPVATHAQRETHLEPDDALGPIPDLGADDLRVALILELVVEALPRTLVRVGDGHLATHHTTTHPHNTNCCTPTLFLSTEYTAPVSIYTVFAGPAHAVTSNARIRRHMPRL
jgi:hypothetical protein